MTSLGPGAPDPQIYGLSSGSATEAGAGILLTGKGPGGSLVAEILPHSIRRDSTVTAAAEALDRVLRQTTLAVPNLLLWARLDRKSEIIPPLARLAAAADGLKPHSAGVLELLAWQFHVDFRDVALSDRMLERFVLESIPWHRIKGTPGAVERALAMYGVEALCDESGRGQNWAVYELELAEVPTLADLAGIVRVAEMSAPERCRLRRLHGQYDKRPLVFDEAPPWDIGYWDDDSGVWAEGGVKVSFGQSLGLISEPYSLAVAALGLTEIRPSRIFYLDRPRWDVWGWDTPTVKSHGFVIAELYALRCRDLDGDVFSWSGPWADRSWAEEYNPRLRRLQHRREVSKSQMVWGETAWDSAAQKMDRRARVVVDNPLRWDAGTWDAGQEATGIRHLVIDELYIETEGLGADQVFYDPAPALALGRRDGLQADRQAEPPTLAVTNYIEAINKSRIMREGYWAGPWSGRWQPPAYMKVTEE